MPPFSCISAERSKFSINTSCCIEYNLIFFLLLCHFIILLSDYCSFEPSLTPNSLPQDSLMSHFKGLSAQCAHVSLGAGVYKHKPWSFMILFSRLLLLAWPHSKLINSGLSRFEVLDSLYYLCLCLWTNLF